MKTFFLSIFFISPFVGLAGKTYTVTITVNQLDGMKPLKGITIQYTDQDHEIKALALTDENGKATFSDCTEKVFHLVCVPTDKSFQEQTVYFYNPDKVDMEKTANLSYSGEKEIEFIKGKTSLANLDSTYILKDSCEFNYTDAEFPGGKPELVRYLQKNMKVPPIAEELGINGKIYLSFAIDHKGAISGITVTKGITDCSECNWEAIRVLAYMQNWIPATCNGDPVASWYKFPIIINVQ